MLGERSGARHVDVAAKPRRFDEPIAALRACLRAVDAEPGVAGALLRYQGGPSAKVGNLFSVIGRPEDWTIGASGAGRGEVRPTPAWHRDTHNSIPTLDVFCLIVLKQKKTSAV